MAVHRAVGSSRQKNSGYRPSRVNMPQGLSAPDPSLSPTHLSIRRGHATNTHYTHHQVSLMVSRNTTLVPSLRLRIVPTCENHSLRWHAKGACGVPNKKREKTVIALCHKQDSLTYGAVAFVYSGRRTTHTRYNLYSTVEMLMNRDAPAAIDAKARYFSNRDFFIPHLHSRPPSILVVLSR